jgi:hypothetical protein
VWTGFYPRFECLKVGHGSGLYLKKEKLEQAKAKTEEVKEMQ